MHPPETLRDFPVPGCIHTVVLWLVVWRSDKGPSKDWLVYELKYGWLECLCRQSGVGGNIKETQSDDIELILCLYRVYLVLVRALVNTTALLLML